MRLEDSQTMMVHSYRYPFFVSFLYRVFASVPLSDLSVSERRSVRLRLRLPAQSPLAFALPVRLEAADVRMDCYGGVCVCVCVVVACFVSVLFVGF